MDIISGHSHSFDVGVAIALGVKAAIVLNHYDEISECLNYMTLSEAKKAFDKLVEAGLVRSDTHFSQDGVSK